VRRSGGRGFVSAPAEQSGVAQVAHATCTFTMPGGAISARTPFVLRARLRDGDTVPGPAVILQDDTTVVVPPGALARCLPSKSILITLPIRSPSRSPKAPLKASPSRWATSLCAWRIPASSGNPRTSEPPS
jgi:hypothetical protein